MFGKTPVTALEEYCAKKNIEKPVYDFINSEMDKSFVCRVQALDETADGIGRSKKESKHDAAANMIKHLKTLHPDIENIPQAPHETISTTDAIAALRDLCLQQDHPFPSFEIIQRTGPPEAPEFTAECRVATIQRYGVASTKKAAKQKAAQQIIEIIKSVPIESYERQLVLIDDEIVNIEEENQKRIKTYREYVESDIKSIPGTLLCDRHNYFKNYDPELKSKAQKVLEDDSIVSDQDKITMFLAEMKIKMKKSLMPSVNGEEIIFIELICDFDCCFSGSNANIYSRMTEYFNDML